MGGNDMKLEERNGKWVEIYRAKDVEGEITLQVPNTIWAGWLEPVHIKDVYLAGFLSSIGWEVKLPQKATLESHTRP
jgi:hypothetical protein